MRFEPYPFEKLRELFSDVEFSGEIIDLTIGEPQFETPNLIQDRFKETSSLLKKYPKSGGEPYLQESMIGFMNRRFGVELSDSELIPTFGTREVLFNFPQHYLFDKKEPKIAFTNPFYQIYEGSAIASRATVEYINLTEKSGFKPKLSEDSLKDTDLVILNFPNNPTTATLNREQMLHWIELSEKYNFVLLNDECYSEIYSNEPPLSLLQVAVESGRKDMRNLLVVNSLSKRSSAPGLRSGFIAGDRDILSGYKRYRTYLGTAVPLPLQESAAVAWSDSEHSEFSRKIYKENLKIAGEVLGIKPPESTFYLWLKVSDDLLVTKKLYSERGLKVIPGRFLGRDGVGEGYIRVALVEKPEKVRKALEILKEYL
jgi:aspartate/methionine/tyrosine aminotransferase